MLEVLVMAVIGAAVGGATGISAAVVLLRMKDWRNRVRMSRRVPPIRDVTGVAPMHLPCGFAGAIISGALVSRVQLLWVVLAALVPALIVLLVGGGVIARQAYEKKAPRR